MNIQAVNEVRAAEILSVAVQTLRNWRFQKKGPAYLKISRCVRYKLDDLERYVESKRVDPEVAA
ncbi:MAG: helix-turn-helix domain-containing protein [Desulfobacterales bacterium]|uniref:Helix-turn-helix domain-containing protein n=1 Tax=Candidatus Desulfatibia profunda TaxID=2841695 RepID=A0A8J6NQF8_9BACT|nr:helix-turn-helix domain-containing protein [Candidatus Desulfatibia profunda]MBL7180280.1 helix-turn-helix domain-containing protein [Desulfobacterales bacterium]MBL7208057.1 helix-turn-helix domain-containing protein [Desulfobacterales bacterium]